MNLDQLTLAYEEFRDESSFVSGVVYNFEKNYSTLESMMKKNRHALKVSESLAMVMDKFIDLSNEETLTELKDLVNQGLRLAFNRTSLRLEANYRSKNNNLVIEFNFYKNGLKEPLLRSQSGGVLDLISFLLRVLVIHKMGYEKFIFMDEALNGISDRGDYSFKASKIIKGICEKRGFTVLLVTHKENLSAEAHNVFKGDKIDALDEENSWDALTLEKIK